MKLLRLIVNTESEAYMKAFTWNISDFANALSKVLLDNYAEVKKVTGLCIFGV